MTTDLNKISLKRVYPVGNETEEIQASSLWKSQPVLFFLVRRTGCIMCREVAAEVSQQAEFLKTQLGINVIAIVKEVIPKDVSEFHSKYFKNDIYVDEKMDFFKVINADGQFNRVSLLGTLFASVTREAFGRAKKKGFSGGSFGGESTITGGLLLVSKDGPKFTYKESIGELPSINEVLTACKAVVPDKADVKLPELDNGDKKHLAQDDVCNVPRSRPQSE